MNDYLITWRTIETIRTTVGIGPTIHLCDDASPYQEGKEFLWDKLEKRKYNIELWFSEKNLGFSSMVNMGLYRALELDKDALLVNADMEFKWPGWIDSLYAAEADVAGGLLFYPNYLIQHAGIFYSVTTRTFDHMHRFAPANLPDANKERMCPVTGALQLIRNETLNEVGVYDSKFYMGWEDIDYCLRVFHSGRKCIYTPDAKALHYESIFRGVKNKRSQKMQKESLNYLYEKHANNDISFVPRMVMN